MNKSKWILLVLKTFRLRSFIRNLFIRRNMQFNVCEAVVFIKNRLLWICKISMDRLTKCITRKRLNTWRWHNDSMYITKHFHVIFYAFAIQYIYEILVYLIYRTQIGIDFIKVTWVLFIFIKTIKSNLQLSMCQLSCPKLLIKLSDMFSIRKKSHTHE